MKEPNELDALVAKLAGWATQIAARFGHSVYLVGSALKLANPRDVDVRVVLPDVEFRARYGDPTWWHVGMWHPDRDEKAFDAVVRWASEIGKLSRDAALVLGVNIDFQVECESHAERWHKDKDRRRIDVLLPAPADAQPPEYVYRCKDCKNTSSDLDGVRHERGCNPIGRWYTQVQVPRTSEATPPVWRTGRTVGNTVYQKGVFVGSMVTPEVAKEIVMSANLAELHPLPRPFNDPLVDELMLAVVEVLAASDEAFEDSNLRRLRSAAYAIGDRAVAKCVTPNGRTDGHFKYVEGDGTGGMRCMFCKEPLPRPTSPKETT